MTRREIVLAMLAASGGRPYSPAQIQKAIFLVSRNLKDVIASGPRFKFEPYDYGPFDASVYHEIDDLEREGLSETGYTVDSRWREYRATPDGVAAGRKLLLAMPEKRRKYFEEVSRWVRSLTFAELVSAIYKEYPEMRARSIFRG